VRHISHSFKTAKIIAFDPTMCKSPDVPLQDELLTRNQPIENRLNFNMPTCYSRLTNITCTTKLINTVPRLVRAHLDFSTSLGQTQ